MSRKHKTLSDDTWYPLIPSVCKCNKCNEICWNGSEYKKGHKLIERRNLLSDGSFYPSIPDLCYCGCGEIVYNGTKYIDGHQCRAKRSYHVVIFKQKVNPFKNHHHTNETKEILKIIHTKTFLTDSEGNKLIYPPIFDLCWCRCNEIVYGGKRYVQGHTMKGRKQEQESIEKTRLANTKTFLLRPDGKKEIYPPIFDLCWCGCNETTWNGNRFLPRHSTRVYIDNIIKKIHERYVEIHPYPPIFDLCHCKKCNETVWGGREFVNGHQGCRAEHVKGEECSSKRPEVREKIRIKMSGSGNPSYIDGRSFLPYCPKFNKPLKEEVRTRDNHICQHCGIIQGNKKHSVHHIHYDKQNCYPDLICLCNRCNLLANKNREYWESLFMNQLNDRNLLFWTRQREKQ